MEVNTINSQKVVLTLSKENYSENVIYKCFYWYSASYSISIVPLAGHFSVTIELPEKESINELIEKIKRDLIDFKTREIITTETKNVRELLIAKAFAHNDDFDSEPPGNVNDPLGFNPTEV